MDLHIGVVLAIGKADVTWKSLMRRTMSEQRNHVQAVFIHDRHSSVQDHSLAHQCFHDSPLVRPRSQPKIRLAPACSHGKTPCLEFYPQDKNLIFSGSATLRELVTSRTESFPSGGPGLHQPNRLAVCKAERHAPSDNTTSELFFIRLLEQVHDQLLGLGLPEKLQKSSLLRWRA